jgi:predicted thioesterase
VAIGLGDLPILSTSHLLNLMESASIASLGEFLETGESTRITKVGIEVLDSVAIGAEIRASATCTDLIARELTFICDVFEGDREIARAEMKRAVVERVSFLARTAAQSIIGQLPH